MQKHFVMYGTAMQAKLKGFDERMTFYHHENGDRHPTYYPTLKNSDDEVNSGECTAIEVHQLQEWLFNKGYFVAVVPSPGIWIAKVFKSGVCINKYTFNSAHGMSYLDAFEQGMIKVLEQLP
jgi:hypothetical protein